MKKVLYFTVGALALWLAGSYWANNWIDSHDYQDFPGENELAAARFLWVVSPAINRENDAGRALKFSWLRASTEINRKEKKETDKIMDVLAEEFRFVAGYLASNSQSLSAEIEAAAAIQLLTYLSRVNLFQDNTKPAFYEVLAEFAQGINTSNPINQENWYREMMIRGQLEGDARIYEENRNNLLRVLSRHGGDIPGAFIEGMMNFYDGILLCVVKKPREALPYLESASVKLADYQKYTTNLFNMDLNVLLLGKGMEAGSGCKELITKVILSGAERAE